MKFSHLFGKLTHTFNQKLLNIYILISISRHKDQTNLYQNICCFIVSKNRRNLRVFIQCVKFLARKFGRVIFLTNFKSDDNEVGKDFRKKTKPVLPPRGQRQAQPIVKEKLSIKENLFHEKKVSQRDGGGQLVFMHKKK